METNILTSSGDGFEAKMASYTKNMEKYQQVQKAELQNFFTLFFGEGCMKLIYLEAKKVPVEISSFYSAFEIGFGANQSRKVESLPELSTYSSESFANQMIEALGIRQKSGSHHSLIASIKGFK